MSANIVTYTGRVFDLLNPKPEMVCIEDIAHSLAYQCRYNGHCKFFYSVAQHCVLMAENKDLPGDPLQKLLHDAAEAYIGDLVRPWKNILLVNFPQLSSMYSAESVISVKSFENSIQIVIGEALGIDLTHSAEVKKADNIMMATEIRDLMPDMPSDHDWGVDLRNTVEGPVIFPWTPKYAEQLFLDCYLELAEKG